MLNKVTKNPYFYHPSTYGKYNLAVENGIEHELGDGGVVLCQDDQMVKFDVIKLIKLLIDKFELNYKGREIGSVCLESEKQYLDWGGGADGGALTGHKGFIISLLKLLDFYPNFDERLQRPVVRDEEVPDLAGIFTDEEWNMAKLKHKLCQSERSMYIVGYVTGQDNVINNVELLKQYLTDMQDIEENGLIHNNLIFDNRFHLCTDMKAENTVTGYGGGIHIVTFPCAHCALRDVYKSGVHIFSCSSCLIKNRKCNCSYSPVSSVDEVNIRELSQIAKYQKWNLPLQMPSTLKVAEAMVFLIKFELPTNGTLEDMKKRIRKWYLDNYCDLNSVFTINDKKCSLNLEARGIKDDEAINSVYDEAVNDINFYERLLPEFKTHSIAKVALCYSLYVGDRIAYIDSQKIGTHNIIRNRELILNDILHCEMCIVSRLMKELLQCCFPIGKNTVSTLLFDIFGFFDMCIICQLLFFL